MLTPPRRRKPSRTWTAASSTEPFSRSNSPTHPSEHALLPHDHPLRPGRLDADRVTDVTAPVHFRVLDLAPAHRPTGEEDTMLGRPGAVGTHTGAGVALAGADRRPGTRTARIRVRAPGRPCAEVPGVVGDCRRGDGPQATSAVGQAQDVVGDLVPLGGPDRGRGVILCVRVARVQGHTRVRAHVHARGLTLRTRGGRAPGAGQGPPVVAGGASATSEIAGHGPLPHERNVNCDLNTRSTKIFLVMCIRYGDINQCFRTLNYTHYAINH